jgi:hypothetical protein
MKVRISRSIEEEELLEALTDAIDENIAPLEDAARLLVSINEILKIQKQESLGFGIEMVDKIRLRLSQIDESLEEVSILLQGYENYLNSKNEQVPELAKQPTPETPPLPEKPEATPVEDEISNVWDSKARRYKTKEETSEQV